MSKPDSSRMSNVIKKLCLNLALFAAIVLPTLAIASTVLAAEATSPTTVVLTNPLGDGVTNPQVIIGNIIKAILSVTGSLALLMFVYGGVIWITSFGEAKKVEKGKMILTWAVLGLALIAASYVLVNAVIQGLVYGSATGA